MDRDKLKRELTEQFQVSLNQAMEAVEKAPDGQWIAASEWQIREIFQTLMAEAYQKILQAKLDAADQAAFSPSKPNVAQQGPTARGRAQRRR
jgi:hypothetical protein